MPANGRSFRAMTFLGLICCLGEPGAEGALNATRLDDGRMVVVADHFRLTVDPRRGGEISDIRVFDGSHWNQVLGADEQTCPAVALRDTNGEYLLANDTGAQLSQIEQAPEVIRFEATGVPKTGGGRAGPWTVRLSYEIHSEGVVFIDLDYGLPEGEVTLTNASLAFVVDQALTKCPYFNTANPMKQYPGFDSGRVAFGGNPAKSYTNEIEAVVEYQDPIAVRTEFTMKSLKSGRKYGIPVGCANRCDKPQGRFAWELVTRPSALRGPYRYKNRLALGLGAAVTCKPKSNVIGQRIYNWVNFLDRSNWYPTNEQIDKMAANGATMVILHKGWMRKEGSNGQPHADYLPRDEKEMVRTIGRAHARGLRVGFYVRGIEPYGFGFFEKYAQRDWDGLFVDWHGSRSVAVHDMRCEPEPGIPEKHYSEYGTHVPARAYFLLGKRMREIVGVRGFLIGHQMCFNSGALANLNFDAYTPGECWTDWEMFSSDVHDAVYAGMMGSSVCTPWPIASPYRTPEGVAKMAAWGFYPHAILAYETYSYKADVQVLAADPDAPINRWVLPYWRLLSVIDMEGASVYNLPSVNVVAATCSKPEFHCLVYKEDGDTYLVIVANLGKTQGQAEVTLVSQVLGLQGEYQLSQVDAATGRIAPRGVCTTTLTTSELPPWGIEGFKLHRTRSTSGKGARE